jgi:hypothetical protein
VVTGFLNFNVVCMLRQLSREHLKTWNPSLSALPTSLPKQLKTGAWQRVVDWQVKTDRWYYVELNFNGPYLSLARTTENLDLIGFYRVTVNVSDSHCELDFSMTGLDLSSTKWKTKCRLNWCLLNSSRVSLQRRSPCSLLICTDVHQRYTQATFIKVVPNSSVVPTQRVPRRDSVLMAKQRPITGPYWGTLVSESGYLLFPEPDKNGCVGQCCYEELEHCEHNAPHAAEQCTIGCRPQLLRWVS